MQTGYVGLLELDGYELGRHDYESEQIMKLENHYDDIVIERDISYNGGMRIDKLIQRLTIGDILIVCSLKFLAINRSLLHDRIKSMEDKGITLKVLDMEKETFSSHIKAIEAFNTYISGMRVKKGAYKARHTKSYKVGRQISVSVNDRIDIIRKKNMNISGVKQPSVIDLAKEYKCSRQTIYNILKGN